MAESAAPSAEPVAGAAANAESIESAKPEAPKQPERKIAPIPTQRLPGVNIKTEADDELRKALSQDRDRLGRFDKEDVLTRAAKREKPDLPPAEKKADKAQDGAPQDEGEPKTPELPEGEKAKGEKIKFAGKEYASISEIEQAHKSLQGMFRSHQEKIKQVSEERDYGYRAAAAWTEHSKKLEARIAELESSLQGGKVGATGGNGAAAPDELPSVDSILEDIDTDAFEQIAIQGGLPHAGKYLAAEILKVVSGKLIPAIQSKFAQQIAPYESQQETQRLMETMTSVRAQVASLKTLDGKDAFPELNDPQVIHEVGKAWAESGLPVEHALTPQGLINAVALYRLMKGLPAGEPVSESGEGAPPRSTPAPGPAASVSAEPVVAPANRGRSNLSPEAQRLVDAINSPNLIDPVLGFPRRKR